MARTVSYRELYVVHKSDKNTVEHFRKMLKEVGHYCFKPIEVREVDGKIVVIDGVHRADACWYEGINPEVIFVSENWLLTDDDIRSGDLYHISNA